ncbi:MFS transporter [Rhodobacterales bacterium HKCCE2091]|nr:MFS transporter [Rhodobacterales bacterium HKCCE2091]
MTDTVLVGAGRYGPRLAALSLVMLLPSLGTSITNVALPTLAASFGANMPAAQWVVIAYLLAVTSLIVGAGRLGDLVGRRRLLVSGVVLFSVASAVCAVSLGLPMLIAARAVQGAGGAVMMSLAVAMVGDAVPKGRTGRAMGLLGTVSAVGTALGPAVGGALIAASGWPSVFALLAGLGVLAVLAIVAFAPAEVRSPAPRPGFELPGVLLLAVSLAAFSAAVTLGGHMSGRTLIGLGIASALGFGAFVLTETRAAAPLVRLDLLRERGLAAGLVSLLMVSAVVMATLVVGPFYLGEVHGLDPVRTGMVMSVGPLVAAATGLPAGRLVDRAGSFPVTIAGLLAVMAGALMLAALPAMSGVGGYLAGIVVLTAGYASFQAANLTAVMRGAAGGQRGTISALLGLSRNLGLICGASVMASVYAAGPWLAETFGLRGAGTAGIGTTFLLAAVLAGLSLAATVWARGGKGGVAP